AVPTHAKELTEAFFLLDDVDQHRPGRDDVDASVRHAGKLARRGVDEGAPGPEPAGLRGLAEKSEQALQKTRQDAVRRAAIERAEADQSLAATDVEQALTSCELRAIEHLVAHTGEVPEHLAQHLRIAAVSVLSQPLRQDVSGGTS